MKILIIAFDGLDYDLIRKYNLNTIKQKEFGRIENNSSIKNRKTPELFASFLTGETHEKHGIDRFEISPYGKIADFFIPPKILEENVKGFSRLKKTIKTFLKYRKPNRDDLKSSTFLDENNRKGLNIPSYNKTTFMDRNTIAIDLGYGINLMKRDTDAEFDYRKKEVFNELDNGKHDVLMAHFHKLDIYQHLFFEAGEEPKIREVYLEINNFARKIINKADDYDLILFMSDHGLPKGKTHNTKAFYSVNKPLNLKNPHITDFYDIIQEKADRDDELDEIDF